MISRIRQLFELSRYQDALEMAREVLKDKPENVEVLGLAAITCLELKDLKSAESFATLALGLAPNSAYQSYILGKVKMAQRCPEEARIYAKASLKIQPENVDYLLFMAELDFIQNKWKESLVWVYKAREKAPNLRRVLEFEAACLINLKERKKASEILKKALTNDPRSYKGHYLSGISFKLAGDYQKARQHFRESLRINPIFLPSKTELRIVTIARKIPPILIYEKIRRKLKFPQTLFIYSILLAGIIFVVSKGMLRFSGLGDMFWLPLRIIFSIATGFLWIKWFVKIPHFLFNLIFLGGPEEKMFLDAKSIKTTRLVSAFIGMAIFFGILYLIFPLPLVGGLAGLLAFMALPMLTVRAQKGLDRWFTGALAAGVLLTGLAALWPLLSQRASHLLIEGMVIFWAWLEWLLGKRMK